MMREDLATREDAYPKTRGGMVLVSRLLSQGKLSPDAIIENLVFARKVRDDPHAPQRSRLRAAELVQKITSYIVDKGIEIERLSIEEESASSAGQTIQIVIEPVREDPG